MTGAAYDIGAFVRKMERLYRLMHETSRRTHREGVARADLSFLSAGAHPHAITSAAASLNGHEST